VTLYSAGDIYLESIPMEVAAEPKTMLAYGIDGSTIPLAHGFPLRLVVPRMLAYKNAKYIYRIEFTDKPLDGYWVKRGYSYEGKVPQSRLREGKY
jgi:DMSO/TMAO reductase YedYZ molybdopterin-dependent catalytic subunit